MDETSIDSHKSFKVICNHHHLPIVESPQKMPHLTSAITINAAGKNFTPMIILSNKKNISDLQDFETLVHFSSSFTGWMTKELFLLWSIFFISELQVYRLTLPKGLRRKKAVLIVDGHSSRASIEACPKIND